MNLYESNWQTVKHLPVKYENLKYHLLRYGSSLQKTLLAILDHAKRHHLDQSDGSCIFFLSTEKLRMISKRFHDSGTCSRHLNMLCAIGFLRKIPQGRDDEKIGINAKFLREYERIDGSRPKVPINVLEASLYDESELARLEERARILRERNITSGNISYNHLCLEGLKDIAEEVYPFNNRSAPEKKLQEMQYLLSIMNMLISSHGYATKQQVIDNALLDEPEIKRCFQIFKRKLADLYDFKRPTEEQKERFGLQDNKFIFTVKEQ